MGNSGPLEETWRRNTQERRRFIKEWAAFVRSHDDEEWARQQHKLINSQLESANRHREDSRS